MGCDMHAHVEVYIDGVWEYFSKVTNTRWYPLYSWLSNVRVVKENSCAFKECTAEYNSEKINIDELSDISQEAIRMWESDAHSLTIITENTLRQRFADELDTLEGELKNDWERSFIAKWVELFSELKYFYEDVRVIMWYDN